MTRSKSAEQTQALIASPRKAVSMEPLTLGCSIPSEEIEHALPPHSCGWEPDMVDVLPSECLRCRLGG